MVKRLVALVVAVGLVVGAIALRRAIDDNPGTGGSDGPAPTAAPATGKLICAAELGAVCDDLAGPAVVKEPLVVTMDHIAANGSLGADAWLVARPWPALANYRLSRAGKPAALSAEATAVGASPLELRLTTAAASATKQACPTPEWKCLLSSASIRLAFDDPRRSTAGLLTLVQQAAAFYGSTDFGTNEFSRFERNLALLKQANKLGAATTSVFEENGLLNFAAADVVTAIRAPAAELAARSQFLNRTEPAAALPPIDATVVIVTASGQKAPMKSDDLKQRLTKAGYGTPAPNALTLPDTDVLNELINLWNGLR